ncbi:hypothetical protein C2869_10110 [Saccharobesus litoralis]|uniref:O-antigen ligase-related domain-containing protein n=1 Tax=Saccharobesus litoralis TaxID=2172099 RepID=A0A2S0VRB2_9ALTE|nr:O-antigen ligase family protein [Saccharobesus litoralis]AWB66756.1 hypothetical protein C2869_10110 [Saccharobesus litoralis]
MNFLKNSSIYLAALVSIPIHNFNINLGFMHLKAFQVFTVIFLFSCFLKKQAFIAKGQYPSVFFFICFLCLVVFSSINSITIERSFSLTFALVFCFLFFIASLIFLNNYGLNAFIKPLIYTGSLYALWGAAQLILFFLGFPAHVNFEAWDVVPRVPYFSSENVHAAFAVITALCALFVLLEERNIVVGGLFVLNVVGLVATGTRGAMLMFSISALIILIKYFISVPKSRLILGIFSCFVILGVIFFWDILFIRFNSLGSGDDGTSRVRLHHFEEIYHYFIDNVHTGVGLGGSPILASTNHDLHNVFLMVLFEAGIYSFFMYVLLISYCLYYYFCNVSSRRKDNRLFLVLVLFIAVWGQAMFEPSTYFFHLYLSLALIMYKPELLKNENNYS